MPIDVSNLPEVAQLKGEIIGTLTNRDTVLRFFTPFTGYNPGPVRVRMYSDNTELGGCCEDLDDTGTFAYHDIEIACIASRKKFCLADIVKELNDFNFRYTAGAESVDGRLVDLFTGEKLAGVALATDKLVWQGDTTLADKNLNRIDGIIKQMTESTPAAQQLTITEGNIYTAIRQAIKALPAAALETGREIAVFVDQSVGMSLNDYYVAKDPNNFTPGNVTINETLPFWGYANVRVIPTRGLNGTNKIIVAPLFLFEWYTNIQSDHMTLDWFHDKASKKWIMDVEYILGVTLGRFDFGVIATITDAVRDSEVYIPVGVVNPLGANGGVLTTDTP